MIKYVLMDFLILHNVFDGSGSAVQCLLRVVVVVVLVVGKKFKIEA